MRRFAACSRGRRGSNLPLGQDPNSWDAENDADGWKQNGESNTVGRGSFRFRITDAQNESEYFDIVYENESDWFMEAYVLYKGKVILSNGIIFTIPAPLPGSKACTKARSQ